MNQQLSKVGVTAFRDPQKLRLSASGVLSGHQREKCRQMPATSKLPRIAHRRHQCGRSHYANAWNLSQTLTSLVFIREYLDLVFDLLHLPSNHAQVFHHHQQQLSRRFRQPGVLFVLNNLLQLYDLPGAIRTHQTEFCAVPSDRIDRLSALFYQLLSQAMSQQNTLLLFDFDFHEPHVWA